jgi:phosphopentomutase
MPRVFLCILDSVGMGGAPDASTYGDEGADTLGHIAEACTAGKADNDQRSGPLHIPNLVSLGLSNAYMHLHGKPIEGVQPYVQPLAAFGYAREISKGKDTPSGHWEIAGVPVLFDWGTFPNTNPAFPKKLTDALIEQTDIKGILGNCHASGTLILDDLGEEHLRTSLPICYTSVDSVFQIAAHEEQFGLERLYKVCEVARKLCDEYNIGRVIARPFIGETEKNFARTANRKDYATPPPEPTLLDHAKSAGREVICLGKIADIYAHSGVTQSIKAKGNDAIAELVLDAMQNAPDGSLITANFVDFDTDFGHRRNVAGYAKALEDFDKDLKSILNAMQPDDLLILTADHGCDPTWKGTDHTREQVPILMAGHKIEPQFIGGRQTFADIGETAAQWLGLAQGVRGTAFL